jgi:hypothetical protein
MTADAYCMPISVACRFLLLVCAIWPSQRDGRGQRKKRLRQLFHVCTITSMHSFYYFDGVCIVQVQVYGVRGAANMSCLNAIMLVVGRVQISGKRRPLVILCTPSNMLFLGR